MAIDVAAPDSTAQDAAIGRSTAVGWIHSPRFDLALFTFSPIAGLFVLWANSSVSFGQSVGILATYLIAIPHYMSSFSFFFGDDNLAYYRTRRLAFFAGPIIIVGLVVLLRVFKYDAIVQVAMFVWNIYHVSAQSSGILSIYRRLNGGGMAERVPARLAILSTNATFALWYVDRFAPLHDMLVAIHPLTPIALRFALLPIAIGSLVALGYQLSQRERALSFAETAFLASSIALFHPYLWVRDSNLATFTMLMGHFIQYLAIVWLLNARKYGSAQGSTRQRLLGRISSQPLLLVGTIAMIGATFYLANSLSTRLGAPMVYIIAWNALTLVHFYLDGLVWAFKNPYVRNSIGPYLAPESRAVRS